MSARPFGFTADALVLKKALARVKPATAGKGSLPILAGVKLTATRSGVEIMATNLDLTISLPLADAVVSGVGEVILTPSLLAGLVVRAKKGQTVEVAAAAKDDEVDLRTGSLTVTARCLPRDEWPRLEPEVAPESAVTVDTAAFARVIPAASTYPERPILTGVLIEGNGRVAATDSYRLYVSDGGPKFAGSVLVPSHALRLVCRAPEAVMTHDDRRARFDLSDGVRVITRIIEGEFPNYRGLIRPSDTRSMTATFDRVDLAEAVAEMAPFLRSEVPIKITVRADGSTLSGKVQDFCASTRPVNSNIDGVDLDIAFDPTYLLALVRGLEGKTCTLEAVDHQKPAQFREPVEGGEHLRLLMPVRV